MSVFMFQGSEMQLDVGRTGFGSPVVVEEASL